jgi:RNA-binding protein
MISSKQRAYLRGLANSIEPIFQVGKSGITPDLTKGIHDALEKREIIKINVLNNCILSAQEVANILQERTRSDVVQIIGNKIVLYRPSKKKPTILLPQ